MRIKKYLLFFFTFFFIIGSASADEDIKYYRFGSTGEIQGIATDSSQNSIITGHYAYRFTFVDGNGEKISNTTSTDINFEEPKKALWNYGGYFPATTGQAKFKFGSTTVPKESRIDFLLDKDSDEAYMNAVLDSAKKNGEIIENILNGTNRDKMNLGDFLVAEKLYTMTIIGTKDGGTYSKAHVCSKNGNEYVYKNLLDFVLSEYENKGKSYNQYCSQNAENNHNITAMSIVEYGKIDYTGTGLELLAILKDLQEGQTFKVNGSTYTIQGKISNNGSTGLYFIKNSTGYGFFSQDLRIDLSTVTELKNFGFTKLTHGYDNAGCGGTDHECLLNKEYGYGVNIFSMDFSTTNECENQTDADALNRSWTGSACCDPGKIYNPITEECSGKKTYTPPGGTTNTYVYGCSPTADICKSNLDSTINNLGDGTLTVNSENETKLNSDNIGECVLYNDKYKVDYNGTTIYCSETLNTDFSDPISGFDANFSSSYTNGKFIPINNMPSLNKKVTCYAPSNINTDVLKNYSKSFNNKTSNMEVSVNFLGSQTHKFSNNDITVKNISKISNAETTYGKTYNKIYFELEYDYSYSSASLNKYISIETALGSTTKIGTAQKTMLNDVNFKIPTGTASGTYTSSIMINNLDNKISNINNETDYEETFTSGSNPGYCVLTYNKKVSAATCTQKYNTYLNKDNVAGYEITYGEGQVDNTGIYPESDCQFEIKYTGTTEDYCESLPSDDTNISTEYHTTGNTTELKFKNTKIQPSLSCNFSFDVQDKIDDILVYRPIDLSNPFPGKNGSGREIGANWDRLDGNLTYEQKYITNRQDVYTKTPLYSVTLTPTQIKEIRNYNKENPYDEFELECNEKGSACYSDFIRKYLNTNKSVCANTNSQNTEAFDSCADYSKR